MEEPLYHWSDGDGGYPTKTWCGIEFYVLVDGTENHQEPDYIANSALGEALERVMSSDGLDSVKHVTCPECLHMLVENAVLDSEEP
jgi:hypothetical protein